MRGNANRGIQGERGQRGGGELLGQSQRLAEATCLVEVDRTPKTEAGDRCRDSEQDPRAVLVPSGASVGEGSDDRDLKHDTEEDGESVE
jgi:hypothetical protein